MGNQDPLTSTTSTHKNGWTYKGFQMETAITDAEDQCPYASERLLYIPPCRRRDSYLSDEDRGCTFRARSRLDVYHAQVLRVHLRGIRIEPSCSRCTRSILVPQACSVRWIA